MITEKSLLLFLRKVQAAPNETLVAYSHLLEDLYPGDKPEDRWREVTEEEASIMRAAVRMGLVTSEFHYWTPDFPEEQVMHGGDYIISLSGMGTEKLLVASESFAQKATKQILSNIPTIIFSTLVSLAGAWAIYLWGPTP